MPGNTITREDDQRAAGPTIPLATPFLAIEMERCPDGVHFIPSLAVYRTVAGERTLDTAAGFDWLEAHFKNGGGSCYVTPLRGPAAAAATSTLADASAVVAGTITASVPGAWGNTITVDIDTAGSDFVAKIYVSGVLKRTSPALANNVALQAWAAGALGGGLITYTPGAGADPAATGSPVATTGGDDDFDGVNTATIAAALARFTPEKGPGSIVLPGRTSPESHDAAADALLVSRVNRIAHLMMPDVSAATIAAQAAAIRAHAAGDMIDMLAGRLTIPGLTPSTTRSVGLDALRTARQGANDAIGVSPNQPAAGTPFGEAVWADGLTHQGTTESWTAAEMELLYDAGVNVALEVDGRIELFGSRTAADPLEHPAGFRLGSARLRMALAELLRQQLERIQFHELDPDGRKLKDLEAKIAADVDRFPASVHTFTVTTGLVAGDTPGTAVLTASIEDLQVSWDAEVITATVSRTVTRS